MSNLFIPLASFWNIWMKSHEAIGLQIQTHDNSLTDNLKCTSTDSHQAVTLISTSATLELRKSLSLNRHFSKQMLMKPRSTSERWNSLPMTTTVIVCTSNQKFVIARSTLFSPEKHKQLFFLNFFFIRQDS